MSSTCPDCGEEMDSAEGVDSPNMSWVCPQCAPDWVYELATTTYDEPADLFE